MRLLVIASLCMVLIAHASLAQAQSDSVSSSTAPSSDHASFVVMVRDANGYRGNDLQIDTVNASLTSTTFIDPVIANTLHLDGDAWPQVVSFEIEAAGRNATKVGVIVKLRPGLPPSPARLLLGALARKLLSEYGGDDKDRAGLEAQRDADQARSDALTDRVNDLQRKLTELQKPYQVGFGDNGVSQRVRQELDEKKARLAALDQAVKQSEDDRRPLIDAADATAKAKADLAAALTAQAKPGDAATSIELVRANADADEAKQNAIALSMSPLADPQSPLFASVLQLRMDIASLEVDVHKFGDAATQPSPAARQANYEQISNQLQTVRLDLEAARRSLNTDQARLDSSGTGAKVVIVGVDPTP